MGTILNQQGQVLDKIYGVPFEPVATCQDCIEKAFLDLLPAPAQVVSLRNIPEQLRDWFRQERQIRWVSGFQSLNVVEGFDALVWFNQDRLGDRLFVP